MLSDRPRPLPRRRPGSAGPSPHRARLAIESLEDRLALATFVVTTTDDVPGAPEGKVSLREAVTRANQRPGTDTIVLRPGVYNLTLTGANEDGNATGDLDIRDGLIFRGAGAGVTIIDGQQADRVFDVRGAGPNLIPVTFQKVTIRNGLPPSTTGINGGGILIGNANLVLADSVVTGNRTSGGGSGGGISNSGTANSSRVTLTRSTVSRNSAGRSGGGIELIDIAGQPPSELALSASTVRDNVAGDAGGGLHVSRVTATHSVIAGNVGGEDGGGCRVTFATLTNCTIRGNRSGDSGGGMFAVGDVTLSRSTVAGNTADMDGGGVFVFGRTMLTKCVVQTNVAGRFGGGIFSVTDVTLANCVVSGNVAARDSGGGIAAPFFPNSAVTLIGSTVTGNVAGTDGGGMHAIHSTVTNCTVADNTALAGHGGGLFVGRAAAVVGSTLSGNVARMGGGVHAMDQAGFTAAVVLTNSTVSGNTATDSGGGVYASGMALLNCTITQNRARNAGGGAWHNGGSGVALVQNTIIAQNFVDLANGFTDVFGLFSSLGNNLIGEASGSFPGFTDGDRGDRVGTFANPKDARLGPLVFNGGPTMTHRPLAGSPAIDAGDDEPHPSTGPLPAFDQRGRPRRKDGDGRGGRVVDIGAVER